MARPTPVVLLAFSLVAVVLSGCIADEEDVPVDLPATDDADEFVTEDGRDLKVDLTAEDELGAPDWDVQEWFGVHVFFGPGDSQGNHFNAIVVEETGSGWVLASDDASVAAQHAVFDFPIFGSFDANTLTTSAFGGTWKLLEFPITEGKSWQGQVEVPDFNGFGTTQYDLTFTATYSASISTDEGPRPGFLISGVTTDGETLIDMSYVPAIGWFAHFWLYDLTTEDTADFLFHAMSMGHGYNWTGNYYQSTADTAVAAQQDMGSDADGNPVAEPMQPQSWTMAESSTYLYGFVYAYAFTGTTKTTIVDPNNELHEFDAELAPGGFSFNFQEITLDAVPGEWRAAVIGAGVASGGGLFLWDITETTGTF